VLTFGCLIPIVDNYLSDKRRPDDWFWFIIIIPMLIVYWFYPYVKIAGVVKSLKSKRKQFFKIRMSQCFNDWVSSDLYSSGKEITPQKQMLRFDLTTKFAEEMDNYYKMFKKIDESPESFLDIYSALELLQAIGLPSLFAIATYFFF